MCFEHLWSIDKRWIFSQESSQENWTLEIEASNVGWYDARFAVCVGLCRLHGWSIRTLDLDISGVYWSKTSKINIPLFPTYMIVHNIRWIKMMVFPRYIDDIVFSMQTRLNQSRFQQYGTIWQSDFLESSTNMDGSHCQHSYLRVQERQNSLLGTT